MRAGRFRFLFCFLVVRLDLVRELPLTSMGPHYYSLA